MRAAAIRMPERCPSGILAVVCPMRWLMISLLVSLVAMLFAVAGVAHHIRSQHKLLRRKPVVSAEEVFEPTEEAEIEP